MHVFQWVLITLCCYRIQRVVTTDDWLPFLTWRTYLDKKAQPAAEQRRHNIWTQAADLFSCPHCFGVWTSTTVYLLLTFINWHHLTIPLPVLQSIATMAGISLIAEQEA